MKLAQILLVALAFGVALNAVEGRRPPPRKFPPPSPSPPPPKSPPPPPPPSPSPPPPPTPSPPPPPSPSPKPPPPPPPPASFEYPHTCKPGNIVPYGEGAGVDCTPYVISRDTSFTGSGWAFTVTTRTAPKRCKQNCATMALGDVKFAINPACRGSVNNNIAITLRSGESYTVSPNYGNDIDDGYASDEDVPARTFRIKFKTALTTTQANGLRFVFSTQSFNNRGCNNPSVFFDTKHGLPSGVAQYAYFSANKKCCGTALATL